MKNLKIVAVLIVLVGGVSGCKKIKEKLKKDDKSEVQCPVVLKADVPAVISTKFYGDTISQVGYKPLLVHNWYNKDNTGFCVLFVDSSGFQSMILFDNAGVVLKHEIDNGKEDDKKDKNEVKETGCECGDID